MQEIQSIKQARPGEWCHFCGRLFDTKETVRPIYRRDKIHWACLIDIVDCSKLTTLVKTTEKAILVKMRGHG